MIFAKSKKTSFVRLAALMLGCSALVAGASPVSVAQENAGPLVTVTGGQIQGQMIPGGGAAFKGIPYAAPPVGELRWRETQPVKPWSGVRQATEYGPGCPAVTSGNGRTSSEDCLFLNVLTPQWPMPTGKKLPVMFWINGGELYGGSASFRAGAESLARHGVILVGANYRGQLFGIPGHPELTAESPHKASGNYMFYDETTALKWVRDNIARFGGDPNNVTIFGQSGGAHFISMYLTSPLGKGLFHRAIVESGSVADIRPYLTLRDLEQMGVIMAQVLNAPSTGALQYLRSLPPEKISAAMPEVRKRLIQANFAAYDEGIDGYTITQSPPDVYRSHKQSPVPLMVGHTARDTGAINVAAADATTSGTDGRTTNKLPTTREEEVTWVKGVLDIYYEKYPDLLDKALKAYGIGAPTKENLSYPPYGTLVQQVGNDLNHRCGTRTTAIWHSAVAPTYEWEFSRSVPVPATHSSELRFVFGYLHKDEQNDENAKKLRETMQSYWTNFARTGNPNGPGVPEWAKFNPAKPQSMEFTETGAVLKTGNRAIACEAYIERMNREAHPMMGGTGQKIRPGNIGQGGE